MLPTTQHPKFEKSMNNFLVTNKNFIKINPNFNIDILKINENDIIGNNIQDFIILSQLGRGSNGTIYKVKSKLNNKEYVIKKVNLKNLNIAQQKEAFREAKILKKVKHPNIIRYYQSFRDEGSLYIIMEYAEGGDLQKLIRNYQDKKKYFSEQEIWRFANELSAAILYLHNHKIIHRDIKTMNVFLSHDYKIKLGDLGFSKIVSNMDALQANRVGTPLYLSPEMIKLRPYDFKVDVWALGCVLYHLSNLEPPFLGENLLILGYNIINKAPKNIPSIYSEKLNKFIMGLLIKNPLHRPKISEVVETLNNSIQAKPFNVENFPNFNRDSATTLFKNFKNQNIKKDEKLVQQNDKNLISQATLETNEFKKYYELNKQILENKDFVKKDNKDFINKQQDIKRLFEPSPIFNAYDPNPHILRTQTSQAQFRYKEKPTEENAIEKPLQIEKNEKQNKPLFEGDLSAITNRIENFNDITQKMENENERLLKEDKDKLKPFLDQEISKIPERFNQTNKIENEKFENTQKPLNGYLIQSSAQKICKELHKARSIANILEKNEVNLFQKFRKNKLSKNEYQVKSSNNIEEKTSINFNMMEFTQTRKIEDECYKLNDINDREKRAMTAFECKREAHLQNPRIHQVDKNPEIYRDFFPQYTFQHFPTFKETRPNTVGSDNKFRKKFTIKDLD